MLTTATAFAAAAAAGMTLWAKARRDHQDVLRERASLLASAVELFPDAAITLGGDGFPRLGARLPDGRDVGIEIIADTLVTRRLPQLWLALTLRENEARRDFAIGALARPTGAEFFSLVHELPDWIAPPRCDLPLLVRGRSAAPDVIARANGTFCGIFSDPEVKEAVATPRGLRIVRRVAEGDRAAHLLLRQIRFPVSTVSTDLIRKAMADAQVLEDALSGYLAVPRIASAH